MMDYDTLTRTLTKKESEIETLSVSLSKTEKRLAEIDYEILLAMKGSVSDPDPTVKFDSIFNLMEDEEEEFQRYLDTRAEKEKNILQLRTNYAEAIKTFHSHSKKAQIKQVDVTSSQLLTGTSYSKSEKQNIAAFLNTSCWIPDNDIVVDIIKSIGAGDSTEVYKGMCRGTDVAVKVLLKAFDEKALEEFRKECQVLKGILNHPNLLLFMGACIDSGKHKIVMEWAPNGSLASLTSAKKHKLSFSRKVAMIKEICTGMNWLHNSKPAVLHLNLKPSNILLSRNYTVKIADYGMGQNKRTITNNSLTYVAPELLKNEQPTPKADVFSYGMLMWYILNEKEPYEQSLSALFQDTKGYLNHLMANNNSRPPLPKDAALATLSNLIERCWAIDPNTRPSFQAILDENKWERITTEGATHGDFSGASVWKTFGKSTEAPWKNFAQVLAEHLELPRPNDPDLPNRVEWQCIKELLEVENDKVLHANFLRFLSFFGPIRTGAKEGPIWLEEIRNLLQKKWFHGPIDARVAQNRIVTQISQPPPKMIGKANGSGVLVRFSGQESTFTITFRKPKEANTNHMRLENPGHFTDIPSLILFVEGMIKKNKLEPTSYERKYQHIFDKMKGKDRDKKTAASNYSVVS